MMKLKGNSLLVMMNSGQEIKEQEKLKPMVVEEGNQRVEKQNEKLKEEQVQVKRKNSDYIDFMNDLFTQKRQKTDKNYPL